MKSFLLVASLLILFLSNLSGAVKNGYEKSVPGLMISLQGLRAILCCDSTLSRAEKRDIRRRIKLVISNIAYYHCTEKLLQEFRVIAPDLYSEIDALKDAMGKVIDVYVKFIPADQTPFGSPGMSSLTQATNDRNSCNSAYGEGSVSVIISAVSNALRVLAHEFGHIIYVVPNIKSYVVFFRTKYKSTNVGLVFGHDLHDQSGKSAFEFERRFRILYAQYLKDELSPTKSFMVQVKPVKRELLEALASE